jgi:hypothetical protein
VARPRYSSASLSTPMQPPTVNPRRGPQPRRSRGASYGVTIDGAAEPQALPNTGPLPLPSDTRASVTAA